MKIIFVCTGNTCRSPMAEGFAKCIFKSDSVSSAGLLVNVNDSVSKNAVAAMKDYGIDISSHKPKPLTFEMINNCDYVIPMTKTHKDVLINNNVPEYKILTLNEEISDPFSQSIEVYKRCAEQINKNIKDLFYKINENNQS